MRQYGGDPKKIETTQIAVNSELIEEDSVRRRRLRSRANAMEDVAWFTEMHEG